MKRTIAATILFLAVVQACAQAVSTPTYSAQAGAATGSAAPPAPGSQAHLQVDPLTKSVVAGTSFLLPKPIYPVSEREDKTYTVEYVFNYARYNYTPAVVLKPVNRVQASYATPEDAFTAFYSAIQSADYEWMLSSWDAASQKYIASANERKKVDSSYWVNVWKQRYVGKKIELVQRIESGIYVLILYRVTDPDTGQVIELDTLPMLLENRKWLATQALAADPLSVTYPDLKPVKEQEVLMTPNRKPPDPRLPPGVAPLNRDLAQQVFLRDYSRAQKDGSNVVVR